MSSSRDSRHFLRKTPHLYNDYVCNMLSVFAMCTTWLIHMCDMTNSYVWHDEFICVTWRIHMCDMTNSHVHDPFFGVTWLVHVIRIILSVFDTTHSYVCQDVFIHECLKSPRESSVWCDSERSQSALNIRPAPGKSWFTVGTQIGGSVIVTLARKASIAKICVPFTQIQKLVRLKHSQCHNVTSVTSVLNVLFACH